MKKVNSLLTILLMTFAFISMGSVDLSAQIMTPDGSKSSAWLTRTNSSTALVTSYYAWDVPTVGTDRIFIHVELKDASDAPIGPAGSFYALRANIGGRPQNLFNNGNNLKADGKYFVALGTLAQHPKTAAEYPITFEYKAESSDSWLPLDGLTTTLTVEDIDVTKTVVKPQINGSTDFTQYYAFDLPERMRVLSQVYGTVNTGRLEPMELDIYARIDVKDGAEGSDYIDMSTAGNTSWNYQSAQSTTMAPTTAGTYLINLFRLDATDGYVPIHKTPFEFIVEDVDAASLFVGRYKLEGAGQLDFPNKGKGLYTYYNSDKFDHLRFVANLKGEVTGEQIKKTAVLVITDEFGDQYEPFAIAPSSGANTHNKTITPPTEIGEYSVSVALDLGGGTYFPLDVPPVTFEVLAVELGGSSFEAIDQATTADLADYFTDQIPENVKLTVNLLNNKGDAATGREVKVTISGGETPIEFVLVEGDPGVYSYDATDAELPDEIGDYIYTVSVDGEEVTEGPIVAVAGFEVREIDYDISEFVANVLDDDIGNYRLGDYFIDQAPEKVMFRVILKDNKDKEVTGGRVVKVKLVGPVPQEFELPKNKGNERFRFDNTNMPLDPGIYTISITVDGVERTMGKPKNQVTQFKVLCIDYTASNFETTLPTNYETNTVPDGKTLTVTLIDNNGVPVVGRTTVEVRSTDGSVYSLTETPAESGIYTTTLAAADLPQTEGAYTLTVFVEGNEADLDPFTFTVYPPKVTILVNTVQLKANPMIITKGSSAGTTLRFRVLGQGNRPVTTPNYVLGIVNTTPGVGVLGTVSHVGDGYYEATFSVPDASEKATRVQFYVSIDGGIYYGSGVQVTLLQSAPAKGTLKSMDGSENDLITSTNVYVENQNLVVESAQSSVLTVYSITGQVQQKNAVPQGTTIVRNLQKGVYIVNVDSKVFKVMIK